MWLRVLQAVLLCAPPTGSQARQRPLSDMAFTTRGTTMIDLLCGGSTKRIARSTIRAAGSTNVPRVVRSMLTINWLCPIETGSQTKGPKCPSSGVVVKLRMALNWQAQHANRSPKPTYSTQPLACIQRQGVQKGIATPLAHTNISPLTHMYKRGSQ
jgi:hypothetical protein